MSKLSELLMERGYVYQVSAPLEGLVDGPKRTLYLGVDPTAESMHVGQLQGMLILRRFLEYGHKLIVLIGGGTGMIGDPGGKSLERNLLDEKEVARNAEALRTQFSNLFGGLDFTMVNNAEWIGQVGLMDFLRDIGKYFTVNEMIKRDSVRPRIETPDASISFTEFSYMLLQAYDFFILHIERGCDMQVGGSDQWGNMISGIELIRKKTGNTVGALSWPLLVDGSGKKFGKSEGNAVWLDAEKTSPFKFHQFWLNIDDDIVNDLLFKMTFISKHEIEQIMNEHNINKGARLAQRRLAYAVTEIAHGKQEAERAERVASVLFGNATIDSIDEKIAKTLRSDAPSHAVVVGTQLIDALVGSGLASSKREARQFITDGAVYLNGNKIENDIVISESDFTCNDIAILKRGKRLVSVLMRV